MIKKLQRIFRLLLTGPSCISLAVMGYVVIAWAIFQGLHEANVRAEWQWFGAEVLSVIILIGIALHTGAVTALLGFAEYRWFRYRWEHYALTLTGLFFVAIDLLIVTVLGVLSCGLW